ncbi:potassium transporter TrkG [Pseudotabrizicola sediminis]|uniref:potassium transporter TrkG n=1 Tax=Pseudotabrizicola sediminis TaxID=2486418 RepID=UPI001FD89FEF|nr:potassium transporter TrkG [Pseudotabrizicola sediminis]
MRIWAGLPLFACLPFVLGAPGLGFTDAYFEAASGMTTTGATVIVGLDVLPPGMNLWRGMLNWIGGLGIAFVAMIFLPVR